MKAHIGSEVELDSYQTLAVHTDICSLLVTRSPVNNLVLKLEVEGSPGHATVEFTLVFFSN